MSKADQSLAPGSGRGGCQRHHASGRSRQHAIDAAEAVGVDEASAALHRSNAGSPCLRGEFGRGSRAGVAAAPGTGRRRPRCCRRARSTRPAEPPPARRRSPRSRQRAPARRHAVRALDCGRNAAARTRRRAARPAVRRRRPRCERGFVERLEHAAVGRQALLRLDDAGIEHRRQADFTREDVRAMLVADAQHVAQPARDDEQRGLSSTLEQRVGGYRRADPHRLDGRSPRRIASAQQFADAAHGGIASVSGIARQHLDRVQGARRVGRHDVGEGAAAVNGEAPAAGRRWSGHGITAWHGALADPR
jgi:hypothetical protein